MPNSPSAAPPSSSEAAAVTLQNLYNLDSSRRFSSKPQLKLPRTSLARLTSENPKTVLYLAYGSNLSAETFKGKRGIRPISSVNVHVPNLELIFDLAGIPYNEPCFANTKYRLPNQPKDVITECHKNRWQKGLVGVVYEISPEDYRTVIATEGGGMSYQDVVVPCYALPDGSTTVNPCPGGASFEAHTLLQPPDKGEGHAGYRIHRPDPEYAQPSARYLKLITDGGEEHELPDEYMAYLYNLQPYTITSTRQRMGQALIIATFFPVLMALLGLSKVVADKDGKVPKWLANIFGAFFVIIWGVYDRLMKRCFGDGERTENNKEGDEESGYVARGLIKHGVRLEGEEKALR